ncbi:hypothetical protein NQZ79_g7555 [Umbelopsis isabellina]|nr:hypothetical protein NQZ79_g7555 [Umbelopsis isabellina]
MYSFKLYLTLALGALLSANAAPINASQDPFAICNGFALESLGTSTIKDGQSIEVKWQVGDSLVKDFQAIELFNKYGLITDLYVGHTPATDLSKTVSVNVPSHVELNDGEYWFRIWGETSKGPHCILISDNFKLTQ